MITIPFLRYRKILDNQSGINRSVEGGDDYDDAMKK